MDRMTSHISHVAFSSASDALVDGTALVSVERIGVDGVKEGGWRDVFSCWAGV
jgi:hypothetical protein